MPRNKKARYTCLHWCEVMKYAVTQVFAQVRPRREKPYGGDVKIALEEMKAIASKVFDIRYYLYT